MVPLKLKWSNGSEVCHEIYICNRTATGRTVDTLYLRARAYRDIRSLRNLPERRIS